GVERGEEREPGALRLATRARLGLCQGLLRPCPKRELQQRQVDQPFAGIVDDVEMNPAMAERAPQGVAGGVLDAQTQLTDLACAVRPARRLGNQFAHMLFVAEASNIV